MKEYVLNLYIICSLLLFCMSCSSDSKRQQQVETSQDSRISYVENPVQDSVELSQEIHNENLSTITTEEESEPVIQTIERSTVSDKDRKENERFRLAELERRRKLALEANSGSDNYSSEALPATTKASATFQKIISLPENTSDVQSVDNTTIGTTATTVNAPSVKKDPEIESIETEQIPQSTPEQSGVAQITFDQKRFVFDTIVEGDVINHKFKFVNTGDITIEILNAIASCGCTRPSFPFIAVEPGGEGYIGVTYNSRTKEGDQSPEIEVITNYQDAPIMLYLDGYVKSKPDVDKDDQEASQVNDGEN